MRPLKDALLDVAAAALCRLSVLRPVRQSLLAEWRFAGLTPKGRMRSALFHRLLGYWFQHVYLREPDPDRRESLKRSVMGARAADWVQTYGTEDIRGYAHALLSALDERLSAGGHALAVQIGSASGKEVAWLAVRHPAQSFIGTDVFSPAIEFSRRSFNYPNLAFSCASALEVPALLRGHECDAYYAFSIGALNYVQPEHLQTLFAAMAAVPRLDLLLIEPYLGDADAGGSTWRGNFSWTHSYRRVGEAQGLRTKAFEMKDEVFYWATTWTGE